MTHAPSTSLVERLRKPVARAGQCQRSGRAQESLRVQPARIAPADSPGGLKHQDEVECQHISTFSRGLSPDCDPVAVYCAKTLARLHVRKDLLLQQYGERIEKLSQQDKLSKFCMDAGFLNVVEIGQYFMTKDTAEFSQFPATACREYTLPRDDGASQPKGWIQGNTKIGPVLEVPTCCLHGKYGVEFRIMFLNSDNSHSWVRISHGSNKFVMNLKNNEQEIPEVQLAEYALKLDAKAFACRSKAKAKPQRRVPAGSSTRTIPIGKRMWTDVEPGEYSLSDYDASKKLIPSSSSWKTSSSRRCWSN